MPQTALDTRGLLALQNTGHAGINSLFSKAHSMDWDIDRDVDWSFEVSADDPCMDPRWGPYGRTATFQALPRDVQVSLTRQALGRQLNILQVGESVAQDVCAKLALLCPEEDYRNHAVAQAMDEARHHVAYARFLEKMGDEVEDIDPFTETLFDDLLASDDITTLVATEQFFLESLAMRLFERMAAEATHPVLKKVVTLIRRDESRHMGFGVLYVTEHMRGLEPDEQVAFARFWLERVLQFTGSGPGPITRARVASRLAKIGVPDAEGLAERMFQEQLALSSQDREDQTSGRRVSHMLTSCRRAGLLAPEILEVLELADHPLVQGALRVSPTEYQADYPG